jgi:hypothetical protein
MIGKKQPLSLYDDFVRNVAQVPDLTLVVNYMVGFPWEDKAEALAKLAETRAILLDGGLGPRRGRVELNTFELERLAPMARFPELYGIDKITRWPWASVLEFTVNENSP